MPSLPSRATLVRRFSPALARRFVSVLSVCTYDTPAQLSPELRRLARHLVSAGLLEQDPTAPACYRQTEAGAEVADRWRRLGWL